jgi:hypothetical protein
MMQAPHLTGILAWQEQRDNRGETQHLGDGVERGWEWIRKI